MRSQTPFRATVALTRRPDAGVPAAFRERWRNGTAAVHSHMTRLARIVALGLPFAGSSGVLARDIAPLSMSRPGQQVAAPSPQASRPTLPLDSTTRHQLTLPDRTLSFTATAGSIRLHRGSYYINDQPEADIAFTAYRLDGADPASRPVTFLFNGGPGTASAWLQFGSAGPWRFDMNNPALAALQPNAETWLDFTDLVFIDPVGTGYSRFVSDDIPRDHYLLTVGGDAASVADTIRRWLDRFGRQTSSTFIVGESYGGIRAPKALKYGLRYGMVHGLILVSPLFDYGRGGILRHVAALPTMAAVARELKGPVTHADMADVERYATTDFLLDFVRGERDAEATMRLADRVAALAGVDPAVSRRAAGRFDTYTFVREFNRRHGRRATPYDTSILGIDHNALAGPLTRAAVDFYSRQLNWTPSGPYKLQSELSFDWNQSPSAVQSVGDLQEALSRDPKLRLLVAHGLFDLVTPYFGSQLVLNQLPADVAPDRIKLVAYPGGHMFYSRDWSRQALRREAEAFMK